MNIPNLLSIFRIVLIPFFVYLYNFQNNYVLAALVLLLSGLTDVADGYIARHFNMVTKLGVVLDPVADKLTQAVVVVALVLKNPEILFLVIVFFIKELCMVTGGAVFMAKRWDPLPAKWFGKLSTFVFYEVMFFMVLFPNMVPAVKITLAAISSAMLLVAFILYIRVFLRIVRKGNSETI